MTRCSQYTPPDQRFDTFQLNAEDCDFIGWGHMVSVRLLSSRAITPRKLPRLPKILAPDRR